MNAGDTSGSGLSPAVAALAGTKHVATLQKHLAQLRGAYDHGNRKLFYDELATAYLLAFSNPTLRSLRAIEDAGRLDAAPLDAAPLDAAPLDAAGHPRHLRKLCRSTMSDAAALFDARLLVPLVRRLRAAVPDLRRRDGQLAKLLEHVQLVDGSLFASAADVAWALRDRAGCSKARLHLRLDGATLLPVRLSVGGKGQSEASVAREAIEPGTIYVTDRGFEHFPYLHAVLDGNADVVLRVKMTLNFTARAAQALDADDAAAGLLSDRVGRLDGSPHCKPPQQELRELVVFDERNPTRPLRLVTSLLDVPARIVAQLYRHRWQTELFFRWLKVHAHFAHLLSRSKNGMTLGFHVAVIATLLIYRHQRASDEQVRLQPAEPRRRGVGDGRGRLGRPGAARGRVRPRPGECRGPRRCAKAGRKNECLNRAGDALARASHPDAAACADRTAPIHAPLLRPVPIRASSSLHACAGHESRTILGRPNAHGGWIEHGGWGRDAPVLAATLLAGALIAPRRSCGRATTLLRTRRGGYHISCVHAVRPGPLQSRAMAYLLIVDDHVDGRDALCRALEKAGHEVNCCGNGQEALAAILARRPDLIVLDIFMPEMDGPSLLEILRSYLRLQSLPVIILTGVPDSPLVDRVRHLRVNAIFVKGKATHEEIAQAVTDELHRVPG